MYPFTIDTLSLELEEAVRVLPGKRHVCRASYQGQSVYVWEGKNCIENEEGLRRWGSDLLQLRYKRKWKRKWKIEGT